MCLWCGIHFCWSDSITQSDQSREIKRHFKCQSTKYSAVLLLRSQLSPKCSQTIPRWYRVSFLCSKSDSFPVSVIAVLYLMPCYNERRYNRTRQYKKYGGIFIASLFLHVNLSRPGVKLCIWICDDCPAGSSRVRVLFPLSDPTLNNFDSWNIWIHIHVKMNDAVKNNLHSVIHTKRVF